MNGLSDFGGSGSDAPTEWYIRIRSDDLPADVLVEILAAEIGVEVVTQVMVDEIAAAGGEAIAVVEAAEGVVDSEVESAGGDERAEFGDGQSERHLAADVASGFKVFGFEILVDVRADARSLCKRR